MKHKKTLEKEETKEEPSKLAIPKDDLNMITSPMDRLILSSEV